MVAAGCSEIVVPVYQTARHRPPLHCRITVLTINNATSYGPYLKSHISQRPLTRHKNLLDTINQAWIFTLVFMPLCYTFTLNKQNNHQNASS